MSIVSAVALDASLCFQPWSPETKRGGYIDLDCGVRVLGSSWYGSTAPQAIEQLATAITQLPPGPDCTVMLFHHGMEGQIARYAGALRYSDVLPLRQVGVDYLALGHIHKNYELEGWIFNPGSLEANSIAESREQMQRGAYLVELEAGSVQAQLCQEYQQRPLLRLTLEADKQWTQAEFEQALFDHVQVASDAGQTVAAIVELRIRGQISFNRLDLNLRELRDRLHALSQALIFLLKYEATETAYQSPLPQTNRPTRAVIEATVFQDLLAAQSAYSSQLEPLTQGLVTLKHDLLAGASEPELYEQVADLIAAIAQPAQES